MTTGTERQNKPKKSWSFFAKQANHGERPAWLALAGMSLGAIVAGVVVGQVVVAGTFVPPGANPPEGNIPSTVWNRLDLNEPQKDAAIQIDGGGPGELADGTETGIPVGLSVGTDALDMGVQHGGQNVLYGVADYNAMADGTATGSDRLLLLQTVDGASYVDRLSVDRDGDVTVGGELVAEGGVNSTGCFGPSFQGLSTSKYQGHLGGINMGYENANNICAVDYLGDAHVCSTAEIMNSIKCATATSPILNSAYDNVKAWVNGGPPGYIASANDCEGWSKGVGYDPAVPATYYGRIWDFDSTNGGSGFMTTCNTPLNFACCK